MRARGRCRHGWKSTESGRINVYHYPPCTECCEPAICVVSKRDISLHNIQRNIWKIQDGGCWHVRFVAFVTILLNRPHRSRRFIYFKALFSCKKHQGKIYKTQRVLVANLATNFWILVASTIILVALATVLGAISCPAYAGLLSTQSSLHVFWRTIQPLPSENSKSLKRGSWITQLLNGLPHDLLRTAAQPPLGCAFYGGCFGPSITNWCKKFD